MSAEKYYPTVVIVGRPNVGKSTLFNALLGRRVSIVEPTPGVTRDRIIHPVEWEGRVFDLVDTGGIGEPVEEEEEISRAVMYQVEAGIETADVVVFLVDVRTGVQEVEPRIARMLHERGKKVILAANKADSPRDEDGRFEFMALGFGEPLVVSAAGRRGLAALRARILEALPPETPRGTRRKEAPRLALIGRRNVGKSSLVNALAMEERVVVSDVPGTTRDAVDIEIHREEGDVVLIDTAGLRKKRKMRKTAVEFYGSVRTWRSIRRADGVLFMIDAAEGVGGVDKRVAGEIVEQCKPCVIVVNKWDLAGDVPTDSYVEYIGRALPGLYYAPVVFISAAHRERVWEPVDVLLSLVEQARTRIQTAKLNEIVQAAVKKRQPPPYKGKSPRIYYAVQTGIAPPTFKIFASHTTNLRKDYCRYIANSIRAASPLKEIPLRIEFVSKLDPRVVEEITG